MSFKLDHLMDSAGVAHRDMLGIDRITIGKPHVMGKDSIQADQLYGVTLGFGPEAHNPISLPIKNKAIFADEKSGSHGFHAIVGQHMQTEADFNVHTDDKGIVEHTAADKVLRRVMRWTEKPNEVAGPTNPVMTAANVKFGVKKSVRSDSGPAKYIVHERDSRGVGAMFRLLDLNKSGDGARGFLGGRYAEGVRHMVPGDGGSQGIVMTEADFNSVKGPLEESLQNKSAWSEHERIYLHLHPIKSGTRAEFTTVPVTFHRTSLLHGYEGGENMKLHSLTTNHISNAVDGMPLVAQADSSIVAAEVAKAIHGDLPSEVTVVTSEFDDDAN
jgi:hypothetical protein